MVILELQLFLGLRRAFGDCRVFSGFSVAHFGHCVYCRSGAKRGLRLRVVVVKVEIT
jgi:hypothetical protein